jgi:hypothetical protein
MALRSLSKRIDFARDWRTFRAGLSPSRGFAMDWGDRYPCLNDKTAQTTFDHHYVFHTAWAARKLRELAPTVHHDISSSLYFCAIASAFVPMKFYDYRPAPLGLSNLESERADLLALPFATGSLPTLSCMHVIEHVGLGRYGDPIDADGDLKALAELQRVVAPGGSLLMVVPVGAPRIQYNAHRIYSTQQIVDALPQMRLADFALIGDEAADGLKPGLQHLAAAASLRYGCGCFHFVKN